MQNQKPFIFALTLILIISFTLLQCRDEPNAVGIGQLQGGDFVSVKSFNSLTDSAVVTGSAFKRHINAGWSSALLIGKYQGYEARALMKFSGIPDTLGGAIVSSAKVTLHPMHYTLGDSSAILSFSAFKITQSWTSSGVTWDSITTASYDITPAGTFSGTVNDTTAITFALDTALVQEWLQNAVDSSKRTLIQGIILVAHTNASVRTFSSFESDSLPKLEIAYTKDGYSDTLTLSYGESTFIADVVLPSDPQLLFLQSGVAYRTQLKFDVSKIPQRVFVSNAVVELTLNRSASRLSTQYTDSLIVQFMKDASPDSMESSYAIGKRLDNGKDVYTFTGTVVTRAVQRWVNGTANNGLLFRPYSEAYNLDLYAIVAPTVGDSTRPRLKVTYTTLPTKAVYKR